MAETDNTRLPSFNHTYSHGTAPNGFHSYYTPYNPSTTIPIPTHWPSMPGTQNDLGAAIQNLTLAVEKLNAKLDGISAGMDLERFRYDLAKTVKEIREEFGREDF